MGCERIILHAGFGLAVLSCSLPLAAAPRGPLILAPDAGPTFLPLSPEGLQEQASTLGAGDNAAIDPAMQEFSRAIGESALAEQQATEDRCKSGNLAISRAQDRFAWAAACRYRRR